MEKGISNKGEIPWSRPLRVDQLTSESDNVDYWTFGDGVSIHQVLKYIDLSKIRAVCDQQSRTKWTSIASRNRLYQFMALSDEKTQTEMRLKALSLLDLDNELSSDYFQVSAVGTSGSSVVTRSVNEVKVLSPQKTKRYLLQPKTVDIC